MIPGWPFSELSEINNNKLWPDGHYRYLQLQRRIIQYHYKYALAVFEALAAPNGPDTKHIFAIEVWQLHRFTGYWRRFSSMRIQRKFLPMLIETLLEMQDQDPEVLRAEGLARMREEMASRDPDEFELPAGFL